MISKYSVKRPYTVLVAVVLVIVLGAVSLSKMTTDLLPDMSFQYALVVTTDMGASPEQVESDVTAPIESAMATTSNIKNISSVSYNSYSVVTLEYEQNANMDSVVIEIQQSLDQVSGQWDDSIGTPMIMKVNPDMMPVLAAAVDKDGMDANALSDYVKNDLAPALESLEGVASVTTTGQLEESVDVTLDQDKIDALNKKIQKKIDEQFEKSQKKIDAGKKKVESGKSSISQGSEQLNSAINQTMDQQKKLYKTEQDLKKQLTELKKQKASLEQIQTGIQTFMKSDAYTGIVTVLKDNPQLAESSEMQAQIKQVNAVVKKQFSALSSLGITVNTYEDLPAASAEVGKLLTKVNTGMKTIERAQQKVESGKVSLAWQILLALVLGILLGSYLHYHAESRDWLISNLLTPAGDIFIHLIKMIVVPIVISTLVVGIAGVGDAKQLGRIGAKTIIYFEVITTVAIVLGITLANVFQPGTGIDMSQLAAVDISKYQNTTAEVQSHAHGLMGTILSLVPTNIVASMAKGDMLPIIFFSVLFGLGLSSLPATHREPLVTVFRSISETMFKVTHMVMRYAPVGVFALISVTVATFGFASLWPLAKLVLLVYFAILFFALVVLGIVARLCGLSIWILIRILKDELILAYSTASSESVLPRIIEKMEAYGAPASITSFVVPTGYSFNLDGSTLYQSIAAIFIAQLYGIDLSIWQEITLVLTLMVTSKGIAGVPGVSFVVLLATLGSVGIPLEGLAFIAGVDRILDMARTALNVVGNALAVLVIAKWEHKFDRKKALAYEREVLGKFDKTAQ